MPIKPDGLGRDVDGRDVYAALRVTGRYALPISMEPGDQRAIASAARRMAARDGLGLSQSRPRRGGSQGPYALRGRSHVNLALVDAEGHLVAPDARKG